MAAGIARRFFILAGIFLCSQPLCAETYTWTDSQGTVNFTDDLSQVPKKYRKKVKKLGDAGAEPQQAAPSSRMTTPAGETGAERGTGGTAARFGNVTSAALYGGREPGAWQRDFRVREAEYKRLEQELIRLEALIKNPVGLTRSRADALPADFRETQRLYREALKHYNDLNEEANQAGVPAEFRK